MRLHFLRKWSVSGTGVGFILLVFAFAGCNRQAAETTVPTPPPVSVHRPAAPSQFFSTQFQDESQYIVETVASDLAEQIYYAKNHRLPFPDKFSAIAVEKPESQFRHPIYDLTVDYGDGTSPVHQTLDINGPIWGTACYRGLVSALAADVGLVPPAQAALKNDTELVRTLTDGAARTIEVENEAVSKGLAANFLDPALHEKAGLLLGAFMIRDYAGTFCELRVPLCRMTAHLCMSQFLENGGPAGIDGQVADIMLLSLMNDETAALTAITGLKSDDPGLRAWKMALRARLTADYREIGNETSPTKVERQAWFLASCVAANPDGTWETLTSAEKTTPDFIRIGNEFTSSVDAGHQFLALALRGEMSEIGTIYQLVNGSQLTRDLMIQKLNAMPGRCLSTGSGGTVKVAVIDWGEWADFFQRHLCNAVTRNFGFMQWKWGVPDDAAKLRSEVGGAFSGLRLYPFVRRLDCTDVQDYHASVDDALKVVVATPQIVPSYCWNYLSYHPSFATLYCPVDPHTSEWHKHNPLPGTVYNIYPRLDHLSLMARPDTIKILADLHTQAPYDWGLASAILNSAYNNHPTDEQAQTLLADILPFNCRAMLFVAGMQVNNPVRYEQLMSTVAALNPLYYLRLGDYFNAHQDVEKAAGYYNKAYHLADAVSGANCSQWLVDYYLQKGDKASANDVAKFGADVYSYIGLQAKADYLESTGDLQGAFEWYQKIAERYTGDGDMPLLGFYLRYKQKTGDTKYDSLFNTGIAKYFANGVEQATLTDFKGPPRDGTRFTTTSTSLECAGMHIGDVVVAVSGIRVHNSKQYMCAREFSPDAHLDLIVWNGSYHEIKASPPGHKFETEIRDYSAPR